MDKHNSTGYRSECKSCQKLYSKRYREKTILHRKKYYEDNIEKIKEWRELNREKLNKLRKEYRESNKNIISEQKKIYYKKNKEHILSYHKEYRKKNRDKFNLYGKNHRIKNNPNPVFKVWNNTRKRIREYLKLNNITKSNKTFDIVGCSPEFLKEHLEQQFIEGMSWDNHGLYGWHIDHIIPLSSAKTEEEIYKLCHYTNLQPLWAEDNLRKSNKILI
jgi:hypothetical protein